MNNKFRNLAFRVAMFVTPLASISCQQDSLKQEVIQCQKEIEPFHTKKDIEEIIQEENTPIDVFIRIKKGILFQKKHDELVLKCQDRWCSMQETYALGTGDCEDGAIIFKAMLSNNPEYNVEIVWLFPKKNIGHTIAVYQENNKWGYVSFNEINGSRFHVATFESSSDAINSFNDHFNKPYSTYTFMNFSDEELKFGKVLNQHYKRNPNWTNLE
ncbi:MAG: hypothetical protein KKA65_00765 [Nanoarchaeota archaeon]|nr:hypothetical protein [Nanoarchaeota archaeon]MBU4351905.1 hypothetical protein [Nanoarchaeota archaeon]MBU4456010.1 hypothetical protein [Nanoarchaeota archaeon]MCG2719952.1 hypothetical protein [Nanoarchaeota archaeon]